MTVLLVPMVLLDAIGQEMTVYTLVTMMKNGVSQKLAMQNFLKRLAWKVSSQDFHGSLFFGKGKTFETLFVILI
jgi:hypothetical protein